MKNIKTTIAIALLVFSGVANAGSGQVMITVPHPGNSNHNGGQLAFSPADGRLYISLQNGQLVCMDEKESNSGDRR